MVITSRFKTASGIIGYNINEDGLEYAVTEKGLYDASLIESLTKSGYKFIDYHGNIQTQDGVAIQDLAEVTWDENNVDELQFMVDMEESVMDEASAVAYFTRPVDIKEIEFKQPNISINTREELIRYLDKCKRMKRVSSAVQDIRPLNSFVAKEALFTVEDVFDQEVRLYLSIIEDRRKIANYTQYLRLVKFLQDEGLVGEDYTADDICTAYLAWGVCGLRTPVINIKTKFDVYSDIYNKSEASASLDTKVGRVKEICLLDKQGVIHYSKGFIDLSDVESFEREDVTPEKEEQYHSYLHNMDSWKYSVRLLNCYVRQFKTRRYFEMLSESGISCEVRVDNDRLFIISAQGTPLLTQEFLSVRGADGDYALLDEVYCPEAYQRYNIVRAKAREMIVLKTVTPPVSNSFDLLCNEGLGIDSAIKCIADRIERIGINESLRTGITYFSAHRIYKEGPDPSIIKKYNPHNYEYENIDELIEILVATRDEMEANGEYLVYSKGDTSVANACIQQEMQTRPIENLEFVKLLKDGAVSIDNLRVGQERDGSADVDKIYGLICLVIRMETEGRSLNDSEFVEAVRNVESADVIEINAALRVRDEAYKGYLKDKAILNAERAMESTHYVYITKVFRELSNNPEAVKRHYMFECLDINVGSEQKGECSKRDVLTAVIRCAIDAINDVDTSVKEYLKLEAPSRAVKLMFKIYLKQVNAKLSSDGSNYIIEEPIEIAGEKKTVAIEIPYALYRHYESGMGISRKFSTLYDWTVYELSDSNCAHNLYCVNARVTPWRVIPNKGITLFEYNFAVNYFKRQVIAGLSESFQKQVIETKAKVADICDEYFTQSVMNNNMEGESTAVPEYDESTIDTVLSDRVVEFVDHYHQRFAWHNKAALAKGQFLCDMRLKSDVVYFAYAGMEGEKIIQEDTYQPLVGNANGYFARDMLPRVITKERCVERLESRNIIEAFNFKEQTFADISRWHAITAGTFNPKDICIYSVGKLAVINQLKEKVIYDLTNMSMRKAEELTNEGLMYQLNADTFLIKTVSGSITMEVK